MTSNAVPELFCLSPIVDPELPKIVVGNAGKLLAKTQLQISTCIVPSMGKLLSTRTTECMQVICVKPYGINIDNIEDRHWYQVPARLQYLELAHP